MPEITSCVRTPDGTLRYELAPDEIRQAIADPTALLWIDIEADGRAEGEAILRDVFGFHQLTIDDCYNTLIDPPKVDDYGEYLFVIVHDVVYDADEQLLSAAELDLYVGSNYVVSVHRSPIPAVPEVRRRAEQNPLVFKRGAGFLAHALMDVLVDDFHPVVDNIQDVLAGIEEAVIDQPERKTLAQLLRLKRNTQRLKRSILPQRDVMNRFSRGEYAHIIPAETLMYYRDVYDHTVRVEEAIDSVRDLAESALNTYLSSVNNRINEVMRALAIVSVVFLPLTLIASVFGTNFESTIPDYGWDAGFVVMLVSMIVLSGGLLIFFRARRWF